MEISIAGYLLGLLYSIQKLSANTASHHHLGAQLTCKYYLFPGLCLMASVRCVLHKKTILRSLVLSIHLNFRGHLLQKDPYLSFTIQKSQIRISSFQAGQDHYKRGPYSLLNVNLDYFAILSLNQYPIDTIFNKCQNIYRPDLLQIQNDGKSNDGVDLIADADASRSLYKWE